MTRSACVDFFEKYLFEVSRGHGYREHENPAARFSREVQAGKYNKCADESYNLLLQETKDMSAFWLDQSRQSASDILRVALDKWNALREK